MQVAVYSAMYSGQVQFYVQSAATAVCTGTRAVMPLCHVQSRCTVDYTGIQWQGRYSVTVQCLCPCMSSLARAPHTVHRHVQSMCQGYSCGLTQCMWCVQDDVLSLIRPDLVCMDLLPPHTESPPSTNDLRVFPLPGFSASTARLGPK